MSGRNIVIKGPRDSNGNARIFHIIADTDVDGYPAHPDTYYATLAARKEPDSGAGIFTEIRVSIHEYVRLARLHDIPLNAADVDAEVSDESEDDAYSETYTCPCGIYVHPARRMLMGQAIHIADCPYAPPKGTP